MKTFLKKSELLQLAKTQPHIWGKYTHTVKRMDYRFDNLNEEDLGKEGLIHFIDDYSEALTTLKQVGYEWDIIKLVEPEKILYIWKPLNNSGGDSYYIGCNNVKNILKLLRRA